MEIRVKDLDKGKDVGKEVYYFVRSSEPMLIHGRLTRFRAYFFDDFEVWGINSMDGSIHEKELFDHDFVYDDEEEAYTDVLKKVDEEINYRQAEFRDLSNRLENYKQYGEGLRAALDELDQRKRIKI